MRSPPERAMLPDVASRRLPRLGRTVVRPGRLGYGLAMPAIISWTTAFAFARPASRLLRAMISTWENEPEGEAGHDGVEFLVALDLEQATATVRARKGPHRGCFARRAKPGRPCLHRPDDWQQHLGRRGRGLPRDDEELHGSLLVRARARPPPRVGLAVGPARRSKRPFMTPRWREPEVPVPP